VRNKGKGEEGGVETTIKDVEGSGFGRDLCSCLLLLFTCDSYAEARNRYRLDVCPSVRPSHAGTVSKRLNILSCFLHHTNDTIAHSF